MFSVHKLDLCHIKYIDGVCLLCQNVLIMIIILNGSQSGLLSKASLIQLLLKSANNFQIRYWFILKALDNMSSLFDFTFGF